MPQEPIGTTALIITSFIAAMVSFPSGNITKKILANELGIMPSSVFLIKSALWRVLDLIQVGVAIREKSRGHRATRDFIREFAPPYKASDTEAAEQCFEPMHRRALR